MALSGGMNSPFFLISLTLCFFILLSVSIYHINNIFRHQRPKCDTDSNWYATNTSSSPKHQIFNILRKEQQVVFHSEHSFQFFYIVNYSLYDLRVINYIEDRNDVAQRNWHQSLRVKNNNLYLCFLEIARRHCKQIFFSLLKGI